MDNEEITNAQPLVAMSDQVKRFVEGVQRLELPDDRGVAVSAAATRFGTLIDGVIEAAVAPTSEGEPAATATMNELMESATSRLERLVTVFREDAAAGNTRLPDMDDLAIGIRMFGMEPDQLVRVLELLNVENTLEPSTSRTALMERLTTIGVPVAEVGVQPPVLIKTLLNAVLTLLAKTDPRLQPLVLTAMSALKAIDELAQDVPPVGNGDGPVIDGDGPVAGVGPQTSGDDGCGGPFTIAIPGDATAVDRAVANAAFRDAIVRAGRRCRPGCIPIRTGMRTSVLFEFDFRCVSAVG